jgi:hypothetical protein
VRGGCWAPVPVRDAEQIMGHDLTFYATFAATVS